MDYSPEDFLDMGAVIAITHRSKPAIYRSIGLGKFPQPVKFGPKKSLWLRREVMEWIEAQIAKRYVGGTANA